MFLNAQKPLKDFSTDGFGFVWAHLLNDWKAAVASLWTRLWQTRGASARSLITSLCGNRGNDYGGQSRAARRRCCLTAANPKSRYGPKAPRNFVKDHGRRSRAARLRCCLTAANPKSKYGPKAPPKFVDDPSHRTTSTSLPTHRWRCCANGGLLQPASCRDASVFQVRHYHDCT